MTNAGFFGQPIEGPLILFQQFVDSDSDHCSARPPVAYVLFIISVEYLSIAYIAFLTYMLPYYSLAHR